MGNHNVVVALDTQKLNNLILLKLDQLRLQQMAFQAQLSILMIDHDKIPLIEMQRRKSVLQREHTTIINELQSVETLISQLVKETYVHESQINTPCG